MHLEQAISDRSDEKEQISKTYLYIPQVDFGNLINWHKQSLKDMAISPSSEMSGATVIT